MGSKKSARGISVCAEGRKKEEEKRRRRRRENEKEKLDK